MALAELIEQKKKAIINKWYEHVVATYPSDTARFLKKESDQFANPVGTTTMQSLDAVFEGLLNGADIETLSSDLDPVIRIRAVQDFTPSKAVSFIFLLKNVVRECLTKEISKHKNKKEIEKELDVFYTKVDGLCLIGFDIYMKCREQLLSFQANHIKDRTYRLLKKADLLSEVPEVGAENISPNV